MKKKKIKINKFQVYLHSPSGIISKRFFAAEKTCKEESFPIPEGIPLKSNSLSFKYNLLSVEILQSETGNAVSLFLHRLRVSNFCHNSIKEKLMFIHN